MEMPTDRLTDSPPSQRQSQFSQNCPADISPCQCTRMLDFSSSFCTDLQPLYWQQRLQCW